MPFVTHMMIFRYDPLKKNMDIIKGGKKGSDAKVAVGIVGLGGLGAMGIKLAKALGCSVTAISRSDAKKAYALNDCGADTFIASADTSQMKAGVKSVDIILNTIPSYHDYTAYTPLLSTRPGAKQILLGLHKGLAGAMVADQIRGGKSRVGMSGIGGIRATQEVMDLCAQNDIKPDIKVCPVEEINEIYSRLDAGNSSHVRYVLDIAGSLKEDELDDAIRRCQGKAAPKLSPFSGGISPLAAVSECCWLICCCKT